jgi:hypothetical protein
MTDITDKAIHFSINSLISVASAVGIVWFIVQPVLISQIGDALGSEIDDKIQDQQRPIENAFASLLKSEITKLRIQIARMETHIGDEDWTEDDAELLASLHIELEALLSALEEL